MDPRGLLVRVIADHELGLFALAIVLLVVWLFEVFLVTAILVFVTDSSPASEKSSVLSILAAVIISWTMVTMLLTVSVWRAWQVAVPTPIA